MKGGPSVNDPIPGRMTVRVKGKAQNACKTERFAWKFPKDGEKIIFAADNLTHYEDKDTEITVEATFYGNPTPVKVQVPPREEQTFKVEWSTAEIAKVRFLSLNLSHTSN